jgi:hypothetical protein
MGSSSSVEKYQIFIWPVPRYTVCMSKESLVFLIGFVLLLVPFLGVPGLYKERLIIFFGVLLMIVGYRLRRHAFLSSLEEGGEKRGNTFVESVAKTPRGSSELDAIHDI